MAGIAMIDGMGERDGSELRLVGDDELSTHDNE